jgi:hypothetical protein
MKLHNLKSFFKYAPYEKSTWIGILLWYGWVFQGDIHVLIHNVLTSPTLASSIVKDLMILLDKLSDIFATFIGGVLVIIHSSYRRRRKDAE